MAWTWRDLLPGDSAITASRRIGAQNPTTAADWADIRERLFKRARVAKFSREQIAEMDFANMARALIRDADTEREQRDSKRK